MGIEASVIEELRSLFKEGATPSRLMQHIVARHPDEGRDWYGLIQDYFREGFGVPIVRGLTPEQSYHDISLQYAYLNEDLLHEMVRARALWDRDPASSGRRCRAGWTLLSRRTPSTDFARFSKWVRPRISRNPGAV